MEPRRSSHSSRPVRRAAASAPSPGGVKAEPTPDPLGRVQFVAGKDGRYTFAMIPIEDYEKLFLQQIARSAAPMLNDPDYEWFEFDDVRAMFAGQKIAAARKAKALTQAKLGKLVGMPQSQISRLEKNPDASSMKLIKKVAKALGVPASKLI